MTVFEEKWLVLHRLDHLDQEIDVMKRLKASVGDFDTHSVAHAKRHRRRVRESFSKGAIKGALSGLYSAEAYVFMGHKEARYLQGLFNRAKSRLGEMEHTK